MRRGNGFNGYRRSTEGDLEKGARRLRRQEFSGSTTASTAVEVLLWSIASSSYQVLLAFFPTEETKADLETMLVCHPHFSSVQGKMTEGILGHVRKAFSKCMSLSSISSPHPNISQTEADVEDVPAAEFHDSDVPDDHLEEAEADHVEEHPIVDGILLIDLEGCFIRRRGRATCETIQKLPPGTRINIEVNASGIPCNFLEYTLLASYMGMIVKDPVLAPLSFDDWRRLGIKRYKTLMCAVLEIACCYLGIPGRIKMAHGLRKMRKRNRNWHVRF